jgi:aldehyde dehydrogenase (NAD+)
MTGMRSNFIGGTWMPSASDAGIDVVNPATEAVIDRVPAGAAADVAAAARAARTAFAAWSVTPPAERARHLAAARDLLAERADTVAAAISADMGAPLAFARRVQVGTPLAVLGTFIDLLSGYDFGGDRVGNSLIVREPAGVAGAITPWNYPLHQIVAKVGAALAAGCTVVLKPAEVAPAAAYELADIFAATGLPPGVFNLVSGTGPVVGEAIAAHPDVDLVSFTGSTWAGRRVAEVAAAAPKRVTLELGCRSAPRKKPSRSPTGRPTGWPRASGRPTRSTPWRSPGGCARARAR